MMAAKADDRIGIRVPKTLKDRWERQAEKERRSLANWIIQKVEGYGGPTQATPGKA